MRKVCWYVWREETVAISECFGVFACTFESFDAVSVAMLVTMPYANPSLRVLFAAALPPARLVL
jgi:hypothetical protein